MSTVARPRSLADDFRRRDRQEIAFILQKRPDLIDPPPDSVSQLAMRASIGPSVRMALHQVDARTLAVAQAIAQEPVTTDPLQLCDRLLACPGVSEAPVDYGLAELHRIGLLWHDGSRYHPVREFAAVVRAVAPGMPAQPGATEAVAPRAKSTRDPIQVGRSAGLHGLLAVEAVRQLIDAFDTNKLGLTRDGKVAMRDFNALAEALQSDPVQVAMWLEIAWLLGLIGPSADATAVLPTDRAIQWSAQPVAQCWVEVLTTWWNSNRDWSAFAETDTELRPTVFGDTHVLSSLVGLRARWAAMLSLMPAGADVANAAEVIRAEQPLAWPQPSRLDRALNDLREQGDMLGFTAHGALCEVGRLFVADQPVERIVAEAAVLLPEVRDRIIVQADLTIVAPTPLPHDLARQLRSFAVVESTGGATVYRLSPASLAGGLAAGMTAEEILALLEHHSDVPVPQPVAYLVRDTAASFGRVQVGRAQGYLTTQDSQVMTAVLAALGPLAAHVERIADTVAIADLPAEQLLQAAGAAGFPAVDTAPVATDVVTAPPPRLPGAIRGVPHQRVDTVVEALFSQSSTTADNRRENAPDVDRMHSAQIQTLLARASEAGQRVWLRYADNAGASSVRLVSGLTLHAGAVEGFDVERGKVRKFAMSRIAGAQVASEQES